MHIPSLTEKGIPQLTAHLNNRLKYKKFTIIHIQKSDGTFDTYEDNTNFTAREKTSCSSQNFIEIRHSSSGGKTQAAFEIHTTAKILITNKIVQITTRPGIINGLRNIILHLH